MSQQSVLEAMRQQIHLDFPIVKQKLVGVPTPPQPTAVFCDRYTEYQGEPRDWLLTMPTPVADMKAVSFSRVSQTLTYAGTRLTERHLSRSLTVLMPMPISKPLSMSVVGVLSLTMSLVRLS